MRSTFRIFPKDADGFHKVIASDIDTAARKVSILCHGDRAKIMQDIRETLAVFGKCEIPVGVGVGVGIRCGFRVEIVEKKETNESTQHIRRRTKWYSAT
jgi:hypothetical protein